MEFLKAGPEDTGEIFHIMNLAYSLLEHKDWYCIDTEEYVREHIEDPAKGIVFKAVEDGQVGAFFIIHYPGLTDTSLGHYMDLDEKELLNVAYMDSLAVLPRFRGRRLQYGLMAHGETYLSATSFCHLMGTVHPDNTYSLNNFLNLGYKVVTTTQKYGSLPRSIMYKRIIPSVDKGTHALAH
ncbi:GNAT family N-acetyltransferase [Enterocloster citroniae]|uniref:GNAT family N-acetyltransferase n=1 Tax=Enterocloster citroniae TaxID=358743 RepID=UPI00189B581C